MKNLLLTICITIVCATTYSQQGYIFKNQEIQFTKGVFKITGIGKSNQTPSQKVKATAGNHFILISLKLLKIENNTEFSSLCFMLTDIANHKFGKPGAWGEIEIMGSKSNFEASEGATVYVRNKGEILNLIFEVPKTILPKHVLLQYDEKCVNSINTESGKQKTTKTNEYTINSIKLFECGETRAKKSDRYYSTSFYKQYTRYMYVEVNIINHLYEKRPHEHTIKFVWYNTKGEIEGEQTGTVKINADWKSSNYSSNGWGRKEAGNWAIGNCKVEVFVDDTFVGKQNFSIKEKEYEVNSIKVFGYGDNKPEKKDREYKATFIIDSLKYLSVEISLKNLIYQKAPQKHYLQLKWYDNNGDFEGEQTDTITIKADWGSATHTSNGWGYNDFGKWTCGNYKVKVFLDNNFIDEKTFEVIKPEKTATIIGVAAITQKPDDFNNASVKYITEPVSGRKIIQVTLIGISGYQNSLITMFDKSNSGLLCSKNKEIILLQTPSEYINPGKAILNNGDFVVDVGTSMKTFGTTEHEMIKLADSSAFRIYGFKRIGEGENLIGVGIVDAYAIWAKYPNNKTVKIGAIKWQKITGADGITQSAQIIKGQYQNAEWTVQLGNKIVEITNKGHTQIGWVTWRTIRLPNKNEQTILMTKTMVKNAKWIGRFNGKLYEAE